VHDLGGIGIKDAIIVCFAAAGKRLMHRRVGSKSRRFKPGFHHPEDAGRKDRAFEWLVGLQAIDHLVVPINVAGTVRKNGRGRRSIGIEHAFRSLCGEEWLQLLPDDLGSRGRNNRKGFVACIGRHVAQDEIPPVDRRAPGAVQEPARAMVAAGFGGIQIATYHCRLLRIACPGD
jgi:hypothetical protein